MARAVNKAILVGNVGNDPEIRSVGDGHRVANVSLATNRTWKDKSGQKQEKTEWHRLTFWGKLVDIVEQYVGKGDLIYVEGSIEYSKTEKDGIEKYWTEINVREMQMLGSKSESSRQPDAAPAAAAPPVSEPDDDLPF
jgi:single-strand DNA-binding protein